MGLTRCFKTEVFYIYICSFSIIFYAIFISQTCLRSRKSISKPHFDKISQSTVEIKLLMVYENRRPPYWNSISGFDFDVCIVIGVSFYISLPNFAFFAPTYLTREVWWRNGRVSHFNRSVRLLAVSLRQWPWASCSQRIDRRYLWTFITFLLWNLNILSVNVSNFLNLCY